MIYILTFVSGAWFGFALCALMNAAKEMKHTRRERR